MGRSNDKGAGSSGPPVNEGRHILYELIADFESLFFITLAKSGEVELRPMQVVNSEETGVLWFVSDRNCYKIQEALEGGVVYIAGQRGSTFVAARGEPTVFTDQPTKERFWKLPMKLWFPAGVTDPSLCFVRLKITSGEYWTTSGMQAIPYVLEAVSAYFNGRRPVVAEPEQHGKIGL